MTYANSKRKLLQALILTLPFGGISFIPLPYSELTMLIIYLYLMVSLASLPNYGMHRGFSKLAMPILLMWLTMLISTWWNYIPGIPGVGSNIRQLLLFSVFFGFAANDFPKQFLAGRNPIKIYSYSVVLMICAFLLGYAEYPGNGGRVSLPGVNANLFSIYCVVGFLIFFDQLLTKRATHCFRAQKSLILIILVSLTYMVALSGSRGGLLILASTISLYLVLFFVAAKRKVLTFLSGTVLAALFVWWLASQSLMEARMLETGDDIRIRILLPTALEIAREHPLFGAGFSKTGVIVAKKTGHFMALHNEYLKILTAGGVVALSLFAVFLISISKRSLTWRDRYASPLLPSILLVLVLFLGKGGGSILLPFTWIFLSICAWHGIETTIHWKKRSS